MNREELIAYLQEKFSDKIELLETGKVEPFFLIKDKNDLTAFCKAIRDDDTLSIDFLCNIAGVDTGERFEVVYNVASYRRKIRFDFKVVLEYEGAEIDSVIEVWAGANWFEREVWELFGINIKNHPNLTRFLLPDDWDQGHPLRKDWDAPDFIRMPEV
jgi:NADH-quinone oxidoreductase subunit C